MLNPHGHFLVPDCRAGKFDPSSKTYSPHYNPFRLGRSYASHPCPQIGSNSVSERNMDSRYGVLELSAPTLESLLRLCNPSVDHEYLLQVVFWWATNGRSMLEKSPTNNDVTTDVERKISSDSALNWLPSPNCDMRNTNCPLKESLDDGKDNDDHCTNSISSIQNSESVNTTVANPTIPNNNNTGDTIGASPRTVNEAVSYTHLTLPTILLV